MPSSELDRKMSRLDILCGVTEQHAQQGRVTKANARALITAAREVINEYYKVEVK